MDSDSVHIRDMKVKGALPTELKIFRMEVSGTSDAAIYCVYFSVDEIHCIARCNEYDAMNMKDILHRPRFVRARTR